MTMRASTPPYSPEELQRQKENNFPTATDKSWALESQVGGDHYKKMKFQPIEFCMANDLGFVEGSVIKYVCRYKEKGGVEDLEKAKHYLELLIERLHSL